MSTRRRSPFAPGASDAELEAERRATFHVLLAASSFPLGEWIDAIFDRIAWVTRYSKGAVTLRDALGLAPFERIDAWNIRQFESALVRLIEREHASNETVAREEP